MDTLVFVVLPSTNDMGGGGYTRVSRWSVGWSRVSRWLIGWSVGEVSQTPQPVFLKVIYM